MMTILSLEQLLRKDTGSYANGIRVSIIDAKADQISLTGISTVGWESHKVLLRVVAGALEQAYLMDTSKELLLVVWNWNK